MRRTLGFCAAVLFALTSLTEARDTMQERSIRASLAAVPRAELPAKVSVFVAGANATNRSDIALLTVRTAIRLKGSATPAIVGAAAQAAPGLAAEIADAAVRERPRLVNRVAKAAAAAAPAQAGRIVVALCRALPTEYRGIVISVADVVPDSRVEILEALGTAFPEFKDAIRRALIGSSGKSLSVVGVLDAVALEANGAACASPSAGIISPDVPGGNARVGRPPFIPLSGRAGSQGDAGSGRNYATP